jgi:AcrR family transcriptional regulator
VVSVSVRTRTRTRAVGEEEKAARRRQILSAAKRVFARKGFQATTIADVAKAARLSYGAVYWYFGSKDDLFHALMDQQAEALRAHIAQALDGIGDDDPEVLLRHSIRAIFEFFESDKALVRLLFRDAYALGGRFERHLAAIYEGFIDDLAILLDDARSRGQVIDVPPRVAAFSVAALIGQLAHRRLSTDDGLEASVVADFAVRLLMDGLRPRGDTA